MTLRVLPHCWAHLAGVLGGVKLYSVPIIIIKYLLPFPLLLGGGMGWMEDLSLPQVILVESVWIRRFHGLSMDSMDYPWIPWTIHSDFFGSSNTQISGSVHGLSTEF